MGVREMPQKKIIIKGAKEHNLKNIDVEIPRDQLVVVTGVSGSGKSSLAFDTLYAEGQRRYVESLSAYARQFLEQKEKPDVESIDGLSPAIAIQQKAPGHNPRSTVGTITEIYDYLRVLYAKIGDVYCFRCGRRIQRQSIDQIVEQVMALDEGTELFIFAPVIKGRKGEYRKTLSDLLKQGFVQGRIDGEIRDLNEDITLERYKKHTIDVLIDQLKVEERERSRLVESLELGLKLGQGTIQITIANKEEQVFSEHFSCTTCGISYGELTPRMFSFNSPYGACPECSGLGTTLHIDPYLIVPNKTLSINAGAIKSLPRNTNSWSFKTLKEVAKHYGFDLNRPFHTLLEEHQKIILYGTGENSILFRFEGTNSEQKYLYEVQRPFEGIIPRLERRFIETKSSYIRREIERYMSKRKCPLCQGERLKKESLAVKLGEKNIAVLTKMSVMEMIDFFNALKLTLKKTRIAQQILKEIQARLKFIVDVGLDYITIDRAANTLSSGEAQRIQLATQIGSKLCGVLYILDEPSIGLHQRDLGRLLRILIELKNLGNTVLVIEHDERTIREADYIIDMGPGAGEHGGEIVVAGPLKVIIKEKTSLTGAYLSHKLWIQTPQKRRKIKGKYLVIKGAREHNLKDIDVAIPLGIFVCVTGVSGSGKSTLVNDILYRTLARKFYRAKEPPGDHDAIKGVENIDKVIIIDQTPIGRTPRSNPATYTGVFTPIRELFSKLPEARRRGYLPGRFSFNVKGGRCEACNGAGSILIEMHFLPDVYVRCDVCQGIRYNTETLDVKYKGKNIFDVLEMTIEEGLHFFKNIPKIVKKLQTLFDVGLGYMKLGQPAPTLSGGEAQRIKLSKELSKMSTGKTLYILDEPTTGLHFADIQKLLDVLNRLVNNKNTIIVIEHNLDVIKCADYIIDLGPEGGERGGEVIAQGTPEEITQKSPSYTGKYLKRILAYDN
jgi:excinuclease ABC subunit A